jgi:hypothetical protein
MSSQLYDSGLFRMTRIFEESEGAAQWLGVPVELLKL